MLGGTPAPGQQGTERRHAAVLFVDLTGFTALVESVQPETVYLRVRPIMDRLVHVVEAHGGDIQQVLGDGFMAVFGLQPGSDAVPGAEVAAAVRAGLALLRAGDRGLRVHVGIECGEVLVSPSWAPARFGVWGSAVNVAKRLCDLAGPATMHIGQQAYELAGQLLVGAGDEPVTRVRARLKGVPAEQIMHRFTWRPAPAGRTPHGASTPHGGQAPGRTPHGGPPDRAAAPSPAPEPAFC